MSGKRKDGLEYDSPPPCPRSVIKPFCVFSPADPPSQHTSTPRVDNGERGGERERGGGGDEEETEHEVDLGSSGARSPLSDRPHSLIVLDASESEPKNDVVHHPITPSPRTPKGCLGGGGWGGVSVIWCTKRQDEPLDTKKKKKKDEEGGATKQRSPRHPSSKSLFR